MKDELFDRYIGALSFIIKNAQDTTKLIQKLRAETITISDSRAKSMILVRLVDHAVINAYQLFDSYPDAISLKNLSKELSKNTLNRAKFTKFDKDFIIIKKKYSTLIKRLKNNRHKRVAHLQEKEQLGLDKKTATRLNELFLLNKTNGFKGVLEECFYIFPSNFPITEFTEMLKEVKCLLLFV
jgi:hypothetical protein